MPNQPELFPQDPETKAVDPRADLEWLLCLASALQAGGGLVPKSAGGDEVRLAASAPVSEIPLAVVAPKWRRALRRLLGLRQASGIADRNRSAA